MPGKPGNLSLQPGQGQAYTAGPGLYGLLRPLSVCLAAGCPAAGCPITSYPAASCPAADCLAISCLSVCLSVRLPLLICFITSSPIYLMTVVSVSALQGIFLCL